MSKEEEEDILNDIHDVNMYLCKMNSYKSFTMNRTKHDFDVWLSSRTDLSPQTVLKFRNCWTIYYDHYGPNFIYEHYFGPGKLDEPLWLYRMKHIKK